MAQRTAVYGNQVLAGELLLWSVRTGLLLVLITPLIVTPGTLFPFVVGKAVFARVIIEITFALWLVLIIFHAQYRPPRSWVLAALIVWLLVSLIAGVLGVSFTRSVWSTYERMQGVVDLAHWVGFVLMAGSVFRSIGDWRLLFTANLAVCVVVSVLGLGQRYGFLDSPIFGDVYRITSTLGNATYMGTYTSISAMIGLGLLLQSWASRHQGSVRRGNLSRAQGRRQRRRRRREFQLNYMPWLRVFWVVAILLSLWAMWTTGTRGAAVGLLTATIAFLLGYGVLGSMRRVLWVSLGVLAVSIVVVVVVLLGGKTLSLDRATELDTMTQRLSSIGAGDVGSIQGRIVSVQAGIDAWREKPLLGWGPENFLIAWGRHVDPGPRITSRFDQAHNKVVEVLTTTGAVGLVSYLAIWSAMGYVMLRSVLRRRGYDQLFVGILGATMASYFVQNLFLFDTPGTVMLFAIMVAFAVSEERWLRENTPVAQPGEWSRLFAASEVFANWRQRLGLAQASRLLHTPPGVTLAVVAIAALTVGALIFYNGGQYAAAGAVLEARNDSAPWAEQVAHYDESVNWFPGLANYPRIYMISQAIQNIESFSDAEFERSVALVQVAGDEGLVAEPENWRLHVALAQFYLTAVSRDVQYFEVGIVHVEEATRLAPMTHSVVELRDVAKTIGDQIDARRSGS